MRAYLITSLLLLLLFGAIGGYLYQQMTGFADADSTPPPVTVAAARASTSLWPQTLTAVGSIRAVRGVELGLDESGEITAITVNSGDRVEAGQLLVQLDNKAELASRERQRAAVELARLLFDRDQRLLQQKSIPQSQYDRSRADLDVARAQLAETEALLEDLQLHAPFDGTIGIIQVKAGTYITADSPIASLQDLSALEVDFSVPAHYAPQLRRGLAINLQVPGFAGRRFDARLQALDSRVDEDSRTLLLRAAIEEADGLLPGMFANLEIDLDQDREWVSVPETAITSTTSGNIVYVLEPTDDDALEANPRIVRTGVANNGQIAILEGLAAGEQVVIAGQNKLYRGVRVRVDAEAPL